MSTGFRFNHQQQEVWTQGSSTNNSMNINHIPEQYFNGDPTNTFPLTQNSLYNGSASSMTASGSFQPPYLLTMTDTPGFQQTAAQSESLTGMEDTNSLIENYPSYIGQNLDAMAKLNYNCSPINYSNNQHTDAYYPMMAGDLNNSIQLPNGGIADPYGQAALSQMMQCFPQQPFGMNPLTTMANVRQKLPNPKQSFTRTEGGSLEYPGLPSIPITKKTEKKSRCWWCSTVWGEDSSDALNEIAVPAGV